VGGMRYEGDSAVLSRPFIEQTRTLAPSADPAHLNGSETTSATNVIGTGEVPRSLLKL